MTTYIEEFARELRELKERSGRSYGVLAARLHVSTSTLHRYCNGAAVPGDYAPVERFARQCGATPEELVALHRRWLLADAAKRRESSRASGTPADASAGASAATEPDVPAAQSPAAEVPAPLSPLPEAGGRRPARRLRRTVVVLGALALVGAALPLVLRTGSGSDDPHAAAPVPTPAVRTPESAPPPVQVTVLSNNWDTQCGQWFLLPQPPAKVPPPPSLQETNAWAAALGGIPAGDLRLELTAQGVPGQPVVLHALYVEVVSSRPAPKGTGYTPASGCGAGLDPASFAIDLDTAVPRARPVAGYVGNNETPAISDFPFQVSASDSQVIDVDAHTADHDVSWYLKLVWSCGDRQGTLRIGDHGKPFRTAGLKGDPSYFFDGTTWSPAPPES
ncbi:helix-turn-helix domain-containing protein [Streptomyces sp. NPDC092296]|uniref:helix-turn-helix domain-containing protein n=1 Tax=Streptomyces sp. NPDC092296 TaxID=3366012 RepID=UPI0038158397